MLKLSKLWLAGMISLFLFVIGLPNWWEKATKHGDKFIFFSALMAAAVFSTSSAMADVLHLKCDFKGGHKGQIELPYTIDMDTASKTVIKVAYDAPTYPVFTGSEISIQEFDDHFIKFEVTIQYGTVDFSIDRFTGDGSVTEYWTSADGTSTNLYGYGRCTSVAPKF